MGRAPAVDIKKKGPVQGGGPKLENSHCKSRGWSKCFRISIPAGVVRVDNSITRFKTFCLQCTTHFNVMATGVEDGSTTQDPPIKTHRGLLNLKKFESSFQASLDEAMANFSADLLDSPVNTRQHELCSKLSRNLSSGRSKQSTRMILI